MIQITLAASILGNAVLIALLGRQAVLLDSLTTQRTPRRLWLLRLLRMRALPAYAWCTVLLLGAVLFAAAVLYAVEAFYALSRSAGLLP